MATRSLRKILLFCLLAVLAAGCQHHAPQHAAKPLDVYNLAKYVKWPDSPDFHKHITPLLSYFDRHKDQSAFDTAISFEDQGFGPIDNYYNFITAGHLFSRTQVHAVLFFDIDLREGAPLACLEAYRKSDTSWEKVCEDTIENAIGRIRYKDWNCDGIKDLSYVMNGWEVGGHGPIEWELWLADKSGNFKKVKGFENLDDPKIDSITHHIFTNTVINHQGDEHIEYKFAGNKIVLLDKVYIDFNGEPINPYYKKVNNVREVKLKPGQELFVPLFDPEDDF
ncbi:MAG: hypothetical protein JWQ38_3055 [Flavipsychrobacter sp.]|nr:hypothetical protein [Flavipsychrobacter sp.]